MDYGTLTDQNGKKIDFRNIILILTTNAGATDLEKNQMGFDKKESNENDFETIKKVFTPEFRNRLDSLIRFNNLDKKIIKLIVSKFIMELETQLNARDITIEISDKATDLICELGYDKIMGARPISRVIDEKIKKPLANEIIHGKLIDGGLVKIDTKNKTFDFQISKLEKVKKISIKN